MTDYLNFTIGVFLKCKSFSFAKNLPFFESYCSLFCRNLEREAVSTRRLH